jgi:hypothetical protein
LLGAGPKCPFAAIRRFEEEKARFRQDIKYILFWRFSLFLEQRVSAPEPASSLRVTATLLRTVFICLLIAVTLRVAMPQSETIWTIDDTPADLIRLILGLIVSIFLAAQLLYGPKDAHAYRTWLYLGLTAVPIVILLLFVVW